MRLYSGLKSYQRNANNREEIPSPDVIKVFNDIANRELPLFFTALKINGIYLKHLLKYLYQFHII